MPGCALQARAPVCILHTQGGGHDAAEDSRDGRKGGRQGGRVARWGMDGVDD